MKAMIYLDNSATSWPKPLKSKRPCQVPDEVGANPGRSGHLLSIEAARILYEAREALATLFHVKDPLRIVFTLNAKSLSIWRSRPAQTRRSSSEQPRTQFGHEALRALEQTALNSVSLLALKKVSLTRQLSKKESRPTHG